VHSFKYRLYFGRSSERIVGYDNERGKGDHRHYRDKQVPYDFSTIELCWTTSPPMLPSSNED